jgi:hypothetical protein
MGDHDASADVPKNQEVGGTNADGTGSRLGAGDFDPYGRITTFSYNPGSKLPLSRGRKRGTTGIATKANAGQKPS